MPTASSDPLHEQTRSRINRAPSPVLAVATPWLLVMLGSLSPALPVIASAPVVPPLGFLVLMAWAQLRPGLLPVWAGVPLGLFDDLFSGQPLGCAVLLWSITMIGLDLLETRVPWRGFALNWLVSWGIIATYLLLTLVLAGTSVPLVVILPLVLVSALLFPLVARLVGLADRFRLIQIKAI